MNSAAHNREYKILLNRKTRLHTRSEFVFAIKTLMNECELRPTRAEKLSIFKFIYDVIDKNMNIMRKNQLKSFAIVAKNKLIEQMNLNKELDTPEYHGFLKRLNQTIKQMDN